MLVPLSWLNKFVEIDQKNIRELLWKITEVGLTCENYFAKEGDIILDFEITPNRPDWMSVVGIAREISAITGHRLTLKTPKIDLKITENTFAVKIKPNYEIVPRITSVIIRNVSVKNSPEWLKKRIVQIGLRPINNLVDITNYVLWMHGSLLHVFDYDKIRGHEMTVGLSKGGESFRSLDGIDYILPKNAIIISDSERIIDLLPLKGGENTAVSEQTKNVLLHSVIVDPIMTRRTSQALHLQSDSSQRAERGLDPNGTVTALIQALSLILELSGGEVASEIIDHVEKEFRPIALSLKPERLNKVLGISFPANSAMDILKKLNLQPFFSKNEIICSIPTYRHDLKIEEDVIEEVARIYGYNNFPKTLPQNPPPTAPVAYIYSNKIDNSVKNILEGVGFSEVYTYSLISKEQLTLFAIDPGTAVKLQNPVSLEYEYLRPTIIANLLSAVKLNQANFEVIRLFELGKTYIKSSKYLEINTLTLATSKGTLFDLKGTLELIFAKLGIRNLEFRLPGTKVLNTQPAFAENYLAEVLIGNEITGIIGKISAEIIDRLGIKSDLFIDEINFDLLKKKTGLVKFLPVSTFPPIIEDMTLTLTPEVRIGDILKEISLTDNLINRIQIRDTFGSKITLRIYYQSQTGNLTDVQVADLRIKIIANLKSKYSIKISGTP